VGRPHAARHGGGGWPGVVRAVRVWWPGAVASRSQARCPRAAKRGVHQAAMAARDERPRQLALGGHASSIGLLGTPSEMDVGHASEGNR
jgi:hypothetical protein